jgi:hypothetical protein
MPYAGYSHFLIKKFDSAGCDPHENSHESPALNLTRQGLLPER